MTAQPEHIGTTLARTIDHMEQRRVAQLSAYRVVLQHTLNLKAARASFAKPDDLDSVVKYLQGQIEILSYAE